MNALANELESREEEALQELRRELLSERQVGTTIATLNALFPEAAADELAAVLGDVGRAARPFVLRGLAELGSPRALEVLVDALDNPRLARSARQHLIRVTRKDLGTRPDAWRRWLEASSVQLIEIDLRNVQSGLFL